MPPCSAWRAPCSTRPTKKPLKLLKASALNYQCDVTLGEGEWATTQSGATRHDGTEECSAAGERSAERKKKPERRRRRRQCVCGAPVAEGSGLEEKCSVTEETLSSCEHAQKMSDFLSGSALIGSSPLPRSTGWSFPPCFPLDRMLSRLEVNVGFSACKTAAEEERLALVRALNPNNLCTP